MGIMKAVLVRDKLKRSKILKNEIKNKYLKSLKHNAKLNLSMWSRFELSSINHFKLRNRCIVTGRGKAINKTFKLSRLEFRRWAAKSMLPGVKKS